MTSTGQFAKQQLDKMDSDSILCLFKEELVNLCDKFGRSGQSGGSMGLSAEILSDAVFKLCTYKSISPLNGDTDEWCDMSDISDLEGDEKLYQNKIDSTVFKNEKGIAYYLDAIRFRTDEYSFTGYDDVFLKDGSTLSSLQYIKKFPFTPITFDISVEKIKNTDNYRVINEDILDEVFRVYDRYHTHSA